MATVTNTAKIIEVADRTEPRVGRAYGTAVERLRGRVPVGALERVLARGDARLARELIDKIDVEDALEPVAEIIKDTLARGGRVGAEEVVQNG